MSTNLNIKAYDLYAKFYQRFETIIFMWNVKNKELDYVKQISKLRLWIINTFLGTVFSSGLCLFIIVREFSSSTRRNLSFEYLAFQSFLAIFGFYWLLISICAFCYGENYAKAWNSVNGMNRNFKSTTKCKSQFI